MVHGCMIAHACGYLCVYVRVCAACLRLFVHVCVCVCLHVFVCVCAYLFIVVHVCACASNLCLFVFGFVCVSA